MNASPKSHFLDASVVHYEWNNAIAPRLTIDPGDTVVFETRDASDEFYSPDSTHEDVMRRVFKGRGRWWRRRSTWMDLSVERN